MRPWLDRLPPWRWLAVLAPLVAALFYAPLAFGGTTPWTRGVIDWLLVHGFALWLCALVLERRAPRAPLALVLPLAVLVALGAAHFWNPRSVYEPLFGALEPLEGNIPWLPGSADAASTLDALLHLGALALGGFALRDALARSRARWLLLRVVALVGFFIAFAGIIQKAIGFEGVFWDSTIHWPEARSFAAFRYHANAASFLNLSWPAALAVWLRTRLDRPGSLAASLDLCVFLLVAAAVFVNTSKAGQVLGLVGLAFAAWRFRGEWLVASTNRAGLVVLSAFLAVAGIAFVLPGLYGSLSNWGDLASGGESLAGRLLAYRACLEAVGETGLFGTGAGTFRHVFPYFTVEFEDNIAGFWQHAHQDWLEGLIEWGWVGFAAWAAIYGGAFRRLLLRIREARLAHRPELSASAALVALTVVLLHGLVDFPLQIPALQLLVVLYLALAWSEPAGPHAPSEGGAKSGF
jgi:O-antigen ligase